MGEAAMTARAVAGGTRRKGWSRRCTKAEARQTAALDAGQSQRIIAMACGSPPQGKRVERRLSPPKR